ncbi:hypothetical protein I4U23_011240 [Adineta vaga]|nr:hypothetical protein I4U23_011240 [Adineta vaga]
MMNIELTSTASSTNVVEVPETGQTWSRSKNRLWLALQTFIYIVACFVVLLSLFVFAFEKRRLLLGSALVEYVDPQPNGVTYVYAIFVDINETSFCVDYNYYAARSDRTNYNYYWLKNYITHIFFLLGQMTMLIVSSVSFYFECKRFRHCKPPNELRFGTSQESTFQKIASILSTIGHIIFLSSGYATPFFYISKFLSGPSECLCERYPILAMGDRGLIVYCVNMLIVCLVEACVVRFSLKCDRQLNVSDIFHMCIKPEGRYYLLAKMVFSVIGTFILVVLYISVMDMISSLLWYPMYSAVFGILRLIVNLVTYGLFLNGMCRR